MSFRFDMVGRILRMSRGSSKRLALLDYIQSFTS